MEKLCKLLEVYKTMLRSGWQIESTAIVAIPPRSLQHVKKCKSAAIADNRAIRRYSTKVVDSAREERKSAGDSCILRKPRKTLEQNLNIS